MILTMELTTCTPGMLPHVRFATREYKVERVFFSGARSHGCQAHSFVHLLLVSSPSSPDNNTVILSESSIIQVSSSVLRSSRERNPNVHR